MICALATYVPILCRVQYVLIDCRTSTGTCMYNVVRTELAALHTIAATVESECLLVPSLTLSLDARIISNLRKKATLPKEERNCDVRHDTLERPIAPNFYRHSNSIMIETLAASDFKNKVSIALRFALFVNFQNINS